MRRQLQRVPVIGAARRAVERAEAERDRALAAEEAMRAERDAAYEERDRALVERDKALLQIDVPCEPLERVAEALRVRVTECPVPDGAGAFAEIGFMASPVRRSKCTAQRLESAEAQSKSPGGR